MEELLKQAVTKAHQIKEDIVNYVKDIGKVFLVVYKKGIGLRPRFFSKKGVNLNLELSKEDILNLIDDIEYRASKSYCCEDTLELVPLNILIEKEDYNKRKYEFKAIYSVEEIVKELTQLFKKLSEVNFINHLIPDWLQPNQTPYIIYKSFADIWDVLWEIRIFCYQD